MDDASCYTSKLAWIWVIEALASFKEVNFSILHDLIEMSPELPHNLGRNMREMLALRILEGLFGPSNGITNDSCSAPASKVGFDLSKSCEDVLQHIVHVTSQSGLRTAGPELLKWDVRPFIIHKRACMPKLALQQLKDSILEGSHPYTDYVKEKSGLAFTNAGEHCAEARTSSGPLLEKTGENESQCNFEHDVLLKAPQSASLDGAQQKIIDYEAEEDMDCCCEAGTSSDSDGYFKDHIDVSMKKHEFLSSQCTDTNLCVEYNEGGQLLVCNTSHCPLVVHEICLGSSPRFDNNELTEFVRGGLEHQQKEVLERLHREKHSLSRKNEDGDPLVKSHENGYLEERVNDQTEETSADEKNKSIISNYSIRVRRQEMHYKYPISPQLRRKNVPWTAEKEEILKLDESSIATSSTKTKRGRLNTIADTATPIRGAKRVREDTRQGTRGQGSGKTKSQSGCQSTTTTQITQPPTAHFAAQSTTTRTRTNAPSASQPVRSTKTATPATSQPVRITKTTTTPSAPQPVKVAKTRSTTQHYAYKANASTLFANKKKTTLGLATRSRTSGRLRAVIRSGRELNNKPKLMIDLTGNPAGPPPIPGGGPVCSWGPPRAGGITFRIAPPGFDIHKGQGTAADKPSPSFEGVQRMENGKGKSTTTNKDKGKKKCGNYEL
ncbi:uncharacterized protein LOC132191382 isoform X2 [Corylus avellana]|uniref:uncharacterized protein LOC132191382 isoform X2 n=1 Tax=Corylus avellana TaxID=13451 RepID=UPI00286ABC6D|nr:uncharacterized protein LOC132191382 isoform X2 [Corylus avellana]